MVKKLSEAGPPQPDPQGQPTATPSASSSADTVIHSSASAEVSDVAAAEAESPAGSAVVPVDSASRKVSDVMLAESATGYASDVALAESDTMRAPSFRMPTPTPNAPTDPPRTLELRAAGQAKVRQKTPSALMPGTKVDDFEIIRLLGRGAFGHVYLARQLSLDRQVALKISANRGSEGRTMARLEHQHIVQVFSEKVDLEANQRLLCMQLVPGVGLDKLISLLHRKKTPPKTETGTPDTSDKREEPKPAPATSGSLWTGAELLSYIDGSGSLPMALDPAALHDREALSHMDAIEATAWFGGRLAEALDFAHGHGVLHRDIKPANILVNPYGRPMLADFNISSQPVGTEKSGEEMFGGTFAYMAPEHLDAFNPGEEAGHDAVTAQSDIFSLGLVLKQLLDGRMNFALFQRKGSMSETLKSMAAERRKPEPICNPGQPGARMALERSIGRCLEPDPEDRFASGAELAEQLDGCRRLRESEQRLPPHPAIYDRLLRRPFTWLVLLVVLPQIGASIINIAYNMTQIVSALNAEQQRIFNELVLGYNVLVYPAAITWFVMTVQPIWQCWNAMTLAERLSEGRVKEARQRSLGIPRFIAILSAIGWFPGGLLFPLVIWLTSGLPPVIAIHFVASFCLSGLIAMSYSLCGVEFVVLRGLYPGLWQDTRHFTNVAREELAPVHKQLSRIEFLAVSIPLVAAIFLLILGHEAGFTYRLLVTALIILGMMGFHITSKITRHLSQVIVALTNTKA